MSEYWVSHKKYFCKYCNIYIADDAPSRRQHESGLRHKGNVERFVRGLYKGAEKHKQDLEEEKREMVRVEQAAQAAYAQDVSAGLVKPGSSSTVAAPKPVAPPKPSTRPSDPWTNYTTAKSLGITDPDEERAKAEAERRRLEGVVGEWQYVMPVETTPPAEEPQPAIASTTVAGVKREAAPVIDDDDARSWRLKKKKIGPGLGEIYDPGLIPIKLKTKQEPSQEEKPSTTDTDIPVPKWTPRGWRKAGEPVSPQPSTDTKAPSDSSVKAESPEAAAEVKAEPSASVLVKVEEPAPDVPPQAKDTLLDVKGAKMEEPEAPFAPSPETSGLFRKRKLPAGVAGSRGGRRF